MLSASHNPPEYNGIKIFDHNGQINKNFEHKIQELIEDSNNISVHKEDKSIETNRIFMDIYRKPY